MDNFDGETIHFNILEAMRYPRNISPLYQVDVIKPITQKVFDLSNGDILEIILNMNLDCESLKKTLEMFTLNFDVENIVMTLEVRKSNKERFPSSCLISFSKQDSTFHNPPTYTSSNDRSDQEEDN
uniref:Uncharacterized protein n=1 Tax=Lactuca sativa TaxID=4236 RepID=A0A9R1VNN2_LACSA|nr:hypothetical protein LSAT_V11C400223250 [Lactuca sativa]